MIHRLIRVLLGLALLAVNTIGHSQTAPDATLKTLKPASGFEVSLWAHEPMVKNPTNIDVDSRGRVWVTEGLNYRFFANGQFKRVPKADAVKILEDTNGDGKADKMTVFADDIFPVPMGIAVQEFWRDGKYRGARVFVGNSPDLLVLEDTDGDDKADKRYSLLQGFGGIDHDHGVHGFILGPDGKLYFTQGDGGYHAKPGDRIPGGATFNVTDKSGRRLSSNQLGTVLRVNLDGTHLERLAYRLRNDYEASINAFGHVFVSDNDDDGNRGSRMVWIMDGGNYGYRTPGSGRHWAEEIPGNVPKLAGTGNGSPCGILVYEGTLFPPEYHGAVLQLDAGTHQINFHPLTRVGSSFRTDYKVLLGGGDQWFRPVDACVAPDGTLVVADWYDAGVGGHRFVDQTTGRLYIMKPIGSKPKAPANDFVSMPGLLTALQSGNVSTRFIARGALLEKGAAARAKLLAAFQDPATPAPHRARLLFVLGDLPGTGAADTRTALADRDPQIREQAIRMVARDLAAEALIEPNTPPPPPSGEALTAVLPLANDDDAGVRRQLLLSLRRVATPKAGPTFTTLALAWDGRDRFYLEALRLALREREPQFLEAVFEAFAQRAQKENAESEAVALPPYFPTSGNEAFLTTDAQLPPANAASKLVGLAWVLQRPESLPALSSLLISSPAPDIITGVDMVIAQLSDPRAGAFLVQRFFDGADVGRQREILRLLASKLGNVWRPVRDDERTKKLFDAALTNDQLRVAAIRMVAQSGAAAFAPKLLSLVRDEQQELSTRAAALEALGSLRHEPVRAMATKLVEEAVGKPQAGPLAAAALTATASFQGNQALTRLETIFRDKRYPLDFRRRAAQLHGTSLEGARRLLKLATSLEIPNDLRTEVAYSLHNHFDRQIQRRAQKEMPLTKVAGAKIRGIREVLMHQGDIPRGYQLFHQDQVNACAKCHRVQGVGNWVGPDLSSIGLKYDRAEMLYHILNPSGAIGYNYVPYAMAMSDGRVLSGLITEESAERLVLKTALGERLVLNPADVETRQPQNVSLMPEKIVETMTEQNLADLISYLATLRQPVTAAGEYYLAGPMPTGQFKADHPIHIQAGVKVAGNTLPWRRVQASRDEFLDLSTTLGSSEGKEVVVYLPVVSTLEQECKFVLNSTSRLALYFDGKPVALTGPRKVSANTSWEAVVKIKPGTSHFLVRVASGEVQAGLSTTLVTPQPVRIALDDAVAK